MASQRAVITSPGTAGSLGPSRRIAVTLMLTVVALLGSVVVTGPMWAATASHSETTEVPFAELSGAETHAAAPSARRGLQSPEVPATALRVVGVTWPTGGLPSGARVESRTKGVRGWGPWAPLEVDASTGPDPGSLEARQARFGSEPLVVLPGSVQVRVLSPSDRPLTGFRLEVVDPGTRAADASVGVVPGSASAGALAPTVLSRADWGADESLRIDPPRYGAIHAAVVHHTAGANGYAEADVPAILRGIYRYHVLSLGWNDIGYNALVDRFGRLWEGRAGGLDKPVVGAQVLGFNEQTFGISMLGDYTTEVPSAPAVASLTSMVAWKLSLAHVDPLGTVQLVGEPTVGPTVMGHRDLNQTSCPGAMLYARLPDVRVAAAAQQGAMFFDPVATPAKWSYGATAGTVVRARVTTSMAWTMTVESACRPGILATVTGNASDPAGITASWDGRLADGTLAPPGGYLLTVSATAGSAATAAIPPAVLGVTIASVTGAPPGWCATRLAGADRFATSVLVARAADPTTTSLVFASGADASMADALVAAPLARAKGAALLLTDAAALPTAVVAEVQRRAATTAYLVGGPGVISPAVEAQLASLGVRTVTRIFGPDRYATAAAVSTSLGGARPDVMIASGESFPDGLVLSGPAARLGRPILLVRVGGVPTATADALVQLGTQRTLVAGGTGVVSDAVLTTLPAPTRVAGADRVATGVAVAAWAKSVFPTDSVVITDGEDDALADTLSGGQLGAVTLYTWPTSLPSADSSWLGTPPMPSRAYVLGGESRVSTAVAVAVSTALA